MAELTDRSEFVVVAPARSGSTMLVHALDSHPDICCHGEVLGRHRVWAFSQKARQPVMQKSVHMRQPEYWQSLLNLREKDHVVFYREYLFSPKITQRAVGFKILYPQLLDLHFADVVEQICADVSVGVIYLHRRDTFRRFLSERLYLDSIARKNASTVVPAGPGVTIDLDHFVQGVRNHEAALRRAQKWLEGHRSITVYYEDLVHNKGRTLAGLQEFLGVEVRDLEYRTKKASGDSPETMIINFSEIEDRANEPKYAPYLAQSDMLNPCPTPGTTIRDEA
jgi:hypothetical protein